MSASMEIGVSEECNASLQMQRAEECGGKRGGPASLGRNHLMRNRLRRAGAFAAEFGTRFALPPMESLVHALATS